MNKQYDIIYADPCWQYNDPKSNDPAMGGITYQTMSDNELKTLNIAKLANTDSLMYMWVTMPKIVEQIDVMESWGFKYITTGFVWVKLNPKGSLIVQGKDVTLKGGVYSGLGHYVNGNVEMVVIGKKGKGVQRERKSIKQLVFEEEVIIAPRGKHSAKPEEIRNRITNLYPSASKIELFARTTTVGWDSLGLEIEPSFDLKNL